MRDAVRVTTAKMDGDLGMVPSSLGFDTSRQSGGVAEVYKEARST